MTSPELLKMVTQPASLSKKGTAMLDSSHVTVREYHPSLHDKVVALFCAGMADNKAAARDDLTSNRITSFVQSAKPKFDDLANFLDAKNGGKMFLATSITNEVVGMFAVLRSDKNVDNHEAEFSRISVASAWRKKGICRLLHDHAVNYSRENLQARSAYLITLSSIIPGMRAYAGLGFRRGYENVLDHRGFDSQTGRPVLVKFWKPL